jgi:hypothetical protein
MRPGGLRPRHRGALGLWLAFAAVPAAAQVSPLTTQSLFQYQATNNRGGNYLAVDGGVVWSDNVLGTEGGASDTLLLFGLSGNVSGEGGRADYHLSTNLALLKYLSGSFPTRPVGFLDGVVTFKIVPGFFSWIARETYSQAQINLNAPASPENLVSLNYITTGPRFTMRPTLRTSVRLEALYSIINTSSYSYATPGTGSNQYTNFDNHRYGGNLKIDRAFSDIASLYLKGDYEKVEFKDEVNYNNFSLATAEAGYNLSEGRTFLDAAGGYSWLRIYDVLSTVDSVGGERESLATEEFQKPTWRFELSRLIAPTQRLGLHASQQFIDAAEAFRLGFDQPAPTIAPPVLGTGNAYLQRYYGLDWQIQGVRTGLSVSLAKVTSDYLVTTINATDNEIKLANAALTRVLSPVLRGDLVLSWERVNQIGTTPPGIPAQSGSGHGARADLQWQVGAHLGVRFLYSYTSWLGVSTNQVGVIASWPFVTPQANTAQALPALSPISPVSTLAH